MLITSHLSSFISRPKIVLLWWQYFTILAKNYWCFNSSGSFSRKKFFSHSKNKTKHTLKTKRKQEGKSFIRIKKGRRKSDAWSQPGTSVKGTKCRTFRFLDEKWNEQRHRVWSSSDCGRQRPENWVGVILVSEGVTNPQ